MKGVEKMENVTRNNFYFCYSERVSNYLSTKGIYPITKAIEPMTKRLYSQYWQNKRLSAALIEYKKLKKVNN